MGYNDNILITSGASIPTPSTYQPYNYVHMRVSFDNVEILETKDAPVESSTSAMMAMLEGKNSVIYIERIGGDVSCGVNDSTVTRVITNAAEAAQYADMPSGIRTQNGSIIPHPILPDSNYPYADNGISWGTDSKGIMLPVSGGYTWNPTNLNSMAGFNSAGVSAVSAYAEKLECYGYRDDDKYVANVGSPGPTDNPILEKRIYTCAMTSSTSSSGAGAGACALCYRVHDYAMITDTTVDASGSSGLQSPYAEFTFQARKRGDSATVFDSATKQNKANNSAEIKVTIQAQGAGAMISIGNLEAKQASFAVSENDIYPPQCVPNEDGRIPLNVIYLYPTYYGLVATNSITKPLAGGSGGGTAVLVGTSLDPVRSPWNNLTVTDASGSASYAAYAKNYLKDNKGSDLEFFPTVLHETSSITDIRLKVSDGSVIKFGNQLKVLWSRCTGFWAYCPLFFHRNLKFTLYFKGAYVANGSTANFTYYVYPLAVVDSGSSESDWSGISKRGATCITATRVCSNSATMESIYKAEFHFKSSKMLRAPVEVFGAEIVLKRKEFQFSHKSGNGTFALCATTSGSNVVDGDGAKIREQYSRARTIQASTRKYLSLITSLSVTTSMDGVSGSMELDGYPIEQGIGVIQQKQSIGELDLAVDLRSNTDNTKQNDNNPNPTIFRGYGMEIATAGSDSDYRLSVKLEGVQRKMSDMKLVCAPFWDGDRLEAICLYFEQYMKLKLYMIDNKVNKYGDAKPVSNNLFSSTGTWQSEDALTKTENDVDGVNDNAFRVPRSFNWKSPAVNFQTGTACLEALKKLAELTSCVFVPANGYGVFYELNQYGCPYYVKNQIDNNHYVTFSLQEIISINMAPTYENWYNSIATFGFLRKFGRDAAVKPVSTDTVMPGINYSQTSSTLFPWSRHNVGVENGFLTKSQLKKIHNTRVRFSKAERYQGTITVVGNTRVTHMYQVIKLAGAYYYVLQISHSIDTSRKMWTTSYQVGYFST